MGHPDLPSWYNNLGITYQTKFEHSNDPSLLMCSLDCFQKAARFITGHVEPRFSAACRWARQSAQHTGSDALAAYQIAMDLVPDLVWLGTSIGQRYGDVQQVGGVAVEAAAWAISCKEYSLALEWLEQGRSVVWNQTLQLRTPLDNLRTSYPSLTEKLEWVASELHHASTQSSIASIGPLNGSDSEIASQKQHRLAEQYKILVNQVRELPGFEDFLLPRKAHQLLTAAKKAPVAVINIHQTRCDALLLLPGRNKAAHVPLTHLTYASRSLQCLGVRERGELRRPLLESDDEIHDEFVVVLATLWTDVVKPILGYLGFQHHPNIVKLPHIIWCTTGAMSFLPLHAAGFYDRPGETVSDYVVSSYTPTITALLSTEAVLSSQPNILAVSQELTPGHTHLPGTKVELSSIKECAVGSSLYTQLDNHHATTSSVLSAMQQHDWVHFACHAHQNVQDPTQSGFFLHDGVLNLATITQRAFSNKGLAFLSACQTATGDKRLADESVHLASGMIMAGYPSVIATMWSVQDSDAPMIVEKVYSRLLKDQVGSDRDVARALHDAVGELRNHVGRTDFARWVPFIYIGM
ncbi:CHAT domain-containing protein [Rhizoctonia solani]|nr:CHAT domain-containing protein [Rhizoctonia solani]